MGDGDFIDCRLLLISNSQTPILKDSNALQFSFSSGVGCEGVRSATHNTYLLLTLLNKKQTKVESIRPVYVKL